MGPLRLEANQRAVVTAHDRLNRAADALHRIQALAASHPDRPLHLDLGALRTAVAICKGMIAIARPELRPWAASAEPVAPATPEPAPDAAIPAASSRRPTRPWRRSRHDANRATASAALDAARTWLATQEPSSPALMPVKRRRAP